MLARQAVQQGLALAREFRSIAGNACKEAPLAKSLIKSVASDLETNLKEITRNLKTATAKSGDEAEEAIARAAEALSQAAQQLSVQAKEQSKALAKGATETVRKHPAATATAVAVAAAALVSLLVARQRAKKD